MFEGKQDLEKQLVRRLRGYQAKDARFVVLRDQDAADCKLVKSRLVNKCHEAGRSDALIRIACHELESWYLADLAAVEKGLAVKGLARLQNKRQYRDPDRVASPARVLMRLAPRYQKRAGSRDIGPHLNLDNQRSRSFVRFVSSIRDLAMTENRDTRAIHKGMVKPAVDFK